VKYPCVHIAIKGAVQGVGFRPFVFKAAKQFDISGWVRNDASGVRIEAVGKGSNLEKFLTALQSSPPPLARVQSFDVSELPPREALSGFAITESALGEIARVDVTRDTAVCPACIREMNDPLDRRYLHPFINCTDCGPRFTIIKSLPYDRPRTTMAAFPLCDDCKKEYDSPNSRRFHAQPICCPKCGPKLALLFGNGNAIACADPLTECVELLLQGKIVAVKGLGGYHLACKADDREAVERLRRKKMREEKPLAVMVRDVRMAKAYAAISDKERALLESPERPIVVLAKKPGSALAPNISPRMPTLGVMLPYTPIHHLLFTDARMPPLVMTSGNTTDEPITFTNAEALSRLGKIAHAFLMHDRDIHVRNDDSIIRVAAGNPVFMRRSRGFVPDPLAALHDVQGIVALGGVLKSTVAFGRGRMCYVSQYIGAIDTVEMLDSLESVVSHFMGILDVYPGLFVCDMHPGSLVRLVPEKAKIPFVTVQHHHAHAVACMAENELSDKTMSVVYDGTGYGPDGCVWGGEILCADHSGFERMGHLAYMPLPGGEAAIKNPGRMAIALLYSEIGDAAKSACSWMDDEEKTAVIEMVKTGTQCIKTSSMGRLFDAVSALLGICTKRTYEGQPAIELEGCADLSDIGEYDPSILAHDKEVLINGAKIASQAYHDYSGGTAPEKVSMRFHRTIARATAIAIGKIAQITGHDRVCLTGGCFQNVILLELTMELLKASGLTVFVHRRLPPNDECISFGQIVIAGARREKELII
jgi:hydrogenase maturation protein HypF